MARAAHGWKEGNTARSPPALASQYRQAAVQPWFTKTDDEPGNFGELWADGSDKLVTVDARPGSPTFGKVVHSVSVGGRHEAHHGGFTGDRRFLWAGGLDTNQIFIFDVHSDPAKPKLSKTVTDFVAKSGGVDFLHPDLLIHDIKTLLMGEGTLTHSSTVTGDR